METCMDEFSELTEITLEQKTWLVLNGYVVKITHELGNIWSLKYPQKYRCGSLYTSENRAWNKAWKDYQKQTE